MAYDPEFTATSWSSEEQITSTKLNLMDSNTDHNYKYKPELPEDAPAGIKIARGSYQVVGDGGTSLESDIVFADDCSDGDPGFANTPIVIYSIEQIANGETYVPIDRHVMRYLDNEGFSIIATVLSGTSGTYNVHFIAMGN